MILDLGAEDVHVEDLVLTLDPGSETTGLALVRRDVPKATSSDDTSPEAPPDINCVDDPIALSILSAQGGVSIKVCYPGANTPRRRGSKVEISCAALQ
jgi:hypothetical protein